jgi:phosphoribosylaminoimidazole carboxylase (NCAIR synthetase)
LAVEMFQTEDDEILVNEAWRLTQFRTLLIEASYTSQFETTLELF